MKTTKMVNSFCSHLILHTVPAGNVKGKTWGPSTVHQRERGHLPAMRQTSARAPQFSKSAPNLDKSRTPAISLLQQQQSNQPIGRLNPLGKSVEGLSSLSNGTTGNVIAEESYVEEDDDEHEVKVKGCFGFIRNDDNYMKRKKYSLDSKMDENQSIDICTPIITASSSIASTSFSHTASVAEDDDGNTVESASFEICTRNLDDVPYDRVFYRTIQKSLDEIFSRDDYNQQFVSEKSRNSKSSGDLTTAEDDDYDSYRFERYDSKFNRECFFVNHDQSEEDESRETESERNTSIKSNNSFQDAELSQNSIDSPLDSSFASITLNGSAGREGNNKHFVNRSFDERTNSMCSDQSSVDLSTASSRKSSVTFRVDNGYGFSGQSTTDSISYRPNAELSSSDVATQFIPSAQLANHRHPNNIGQNTISQPHYHHMKPIRTGDGVLKSALSKKDKRDKPSKSKFKGFTNQLLKLTRGNTLLHSNSFYNKLENKTDLKEQLLVDNQSSSLNVSETQYETVFTKNFLLAKQSEK